MRTNTKKGVFSESLSTSFSCPYFPHHGKETQTLQPLQPNTVLRVGQGEKKVDRSEEGIFNSVKSQVETGAKRGINLQKFKPDGAEG